MKFKTKEKFILTNEYNKIYWCNVWNVYRKKWFKHSTSIKSRIKYNGRSEVDLNSIRRKTISLIASICISSDSLTQVCEFDVRVEVDVYSWPSYFLISFHFMFFLIFISIFGIDHFIGATTNSTDWLKDYLCDLIYSSIERFILRTSVFSFSSLENRKAEIVLSNLKFLSQLIDSIWSYVDLIFYNDWCDAGETNFFSIS